MFKPGDKVMLPYDDQPDNDTILGKTVEVVRVSTTSMPFWTVVKYEGREYSVRGSDCRSVR